MSCFFLDLTKLQFSCSKNSTSYLGVSGTGKCFLGQPLPCFTRGRKSGSLSVHVVAVVSKLLCASFRGLPLGAVALRFPYMLQYWKKTIISSCSGRTCMYCNVGADFHIFVHVFQQNARKSETVITNY